MMEGDFDGGDSFDGASPSEGDAGDLGSVWNGLSADRPAPEQNTGIEPPTSWPAERKARWGSLAPEDREFIAARERDAHKRISEQGAELSRLRQEYERLA